jgi:hypothetical protein
MCAVSEASYILRSPTCSNAAASSLGPVSGQAKVLVPCKVSVGIKRSSGIPEDLSQDQAGAKSNTQREPRHVTQFSPTSAL